MQLQGLNFSGGQISCFFSFAKFLFCFYYVGLFSEGAFEESVAGVETRSPFILGLAFVEVEWASHILSLRFS